MALPSLDTWIHVEFPQLLAAYTEAQGHPPEPDFEWAAFQTYRRYMEPTVWTFEKMLAWEKNGGKAPINPPSTSSVSSLRVDGPLFYNQEGIWTLKGFTFFKGLNIHANGGDIDGLLDEFRGYNSPRIFLYTPRKYWGNEAWDLPSKEQVLSFVQYCNSRGLVPKITLATDDDASKVAPIREIIRYLESFDIVLIYEAVNEPFIKDKLSPNVFKDLLESSKFLYTSGIYTDNTLFWGKFWDDHSPRDAAWWRKGGHNLYEAYFGGGPNKKEEPALKRAGIEGEPIKANECGYDVIGLYTYAASCILFGAGATFHCESAKFGQHLNQNELDCKDAFLHGLEVFPADSALGINNYGRVVEPGNEEGGNNQDGRTYKVGNHSIRIHQKGNSHPEFGWNPLDDMGICFGR